MKYTARVSWDDGTKTVYKFRTEDDCRRLEGMLTMQAGAYHILVTCDEGRTLVFQTPI